MHTNNQLIAFRLNEVGLAFGTEEPPLRILEIGAGQGIQSSELVKRGFNVYAVDVGVHVNVKKGDCHFVLYDGSRLPFLTGVFDIVFTSNVLEHVKNLSALSEDIHRVLHPKGKCIHILPSTTWRLLTSISHYVFLAQILYGHIVAALGHKQSVGSTLPRAKSQPFISLLWKILVSPKHGERGNAFTEAYYFSRYFWTKLLRQHGWEVFAYQKSGLAYSGNGVLGASLSINKRALLSKVLGSSCHIFFVQPQTATTSLSTNAAK